MELDERLEVGERLGGLDELDRPGGLGPVDLAPDLVALLLAEGREEVVDRGAAALGAPRRQRRDGTDVLGLEVEGPALIDLVAADCRGERLRGWIAGAEAAEVDDVP